MAARPEAEHVRTAELISALCLATDLGMAFPFERGAGFTEVRVEEVSGRCTVPDVDEYLSLTADTAGPVGLVLRGLPDADRAVLRADVEGPFQGFAVGTATSFPALPSARPRAEG